MGMIGKELFMIDLLEFIFTLSSFQNYWYASPLIFSQRNTGAHSSYAL
jgi:hypothetical protein